MKGSVVRRGRKWLARIDLPHGEGEARKQTGATFTSKKDAEEWLARQLLSKPNGAIAAQRMTAQGYLEYYLTQVEPSLKVGTHRSYTSALRRWYPWIGSALLGDLTPLLIQEAIAHLAETDLAASTMNGSYAALRTALRQAVSWRLLAADPTNGVKRPRWAVPEMEFWSGEQAARFIAWVAGKTRYDALYTLALATGARGGELLALRWSDLDVDAGSVRIARSLSWPSGGEPVLADPKTYSSRRTIDVDPHTLKSLRSQRARQAEDRLRSGQAWLNLNLVFATRRGGYLRQADIDHTLARLAGRAGVPSIRFHDLRHTHATLLLADGRDVKEVADRLGHRDPAITLRRYAHVLPDRRSQAAASIARALYGTGQ